MFTDELSKLLIRLQFGKYVTLKTAIRMDHLLIHFRQWMKNINDFIYQWSLYALVGNWITGSSFLLFYWENIYILRYLLVKMTVIFV